MIDERKYNRWTLWLLIAVLTYFVVAVWVVTAHAEDRYGSTDPAMARTIIYRCVDEVKREVVVRGKKRVSREAALKWCTEKYLRDLRADVGLSEALIEGITKSVYPEATSPRASTPSPAPAAPRRPDWLDEIEAQSRLEHDAWLKQKRVEVERDEREFERQRGTLAP